MSTNELKKYQQKINQQLASLRPVFSKASIGDFSQDVPIPKDEDELTEFFVGIQIMIEVIREKTAELENLNTNLKTEVEKQTAELTLKESQLRNIIENSTNLFYEQNTKNELIYVSPQARTFLGISPEKARGNWKTFISDNPINKTGIARMRLAISTGKPQPAYELELKRADGTPTLVLVNEAPVKQNGEVVSIVGSLTDITQLKRVQEELKKTVAELRHQKSDLQNLNQILVGRELRMVELKNQLKKLRSKKQH